MNKPAYRDILDQIREAFPQPVSDRTHDAYFVFSILRALDQVDSMKSEVPILGSPQKLDYATARTARVDYAGQSVESVATDLVSKLEGLPIWGHPHTQVNVVAPPTIPSIIGSLLPSIYNPNLVSDDSSYGLAVVEATVAAMIADLVGYSLDQSTGFFTFGGTGTNLYAAKIGLEKAVRNAMVTGLNGQATLIASQQSHYCRLNVAGWLGIGEQNVHSIPTSLANDIKIDNLVEEVHRVIKQGKRIAVIVATMGTTDALGIDDLASIVRLRDEVVERYSLDYIPHIHADAVIGWVWSVFNDYDIEENPLNFRPRTLRAIAGAKRRISKLDLADSIGIDLHKTGFAPYISSMILLKNKHDLSTLVRGRDKMPYLFQTGEHHPGVYTLETSRSGGGVLAAYANLRLLGRQGFQVILGHLIEMSELLREHLEGHTSTTVLNGLNFGTVTLFRVYPDGVDTWTIKDREREDPAMRDQLLAHNQYNEKIFHYLHEEAMQGRGILISMTKCFRESDYGEPIVALKSYILSPFVDDEHVKLLVSKVLEAREAIAAT